MNSIDNRFLLFPFTCRIKNQTAFDKIWDIVRNSLNQSQFNFKHAGTMTGAKEGITGWGALNYLSSGFKSKVCFHM